MSVVYPMPSQLRAPKDGSGCGYVGRQRTSTCLSPKRSISVSKALCASQSLPACAMRSSAVAKILFKSTPRSKTSHSSPAYFVDKAVRASPRSSSQACRSNGAGVCADTTVVRRKQQDCEQRNGVCHHHPGLVRNACDAHICIQGHSPLAAARSLFLIKSPDFPSSYFVYRDSAR